MVERCSSGIYAFKKDKASGYRTAKQGVIFAVNGQAHASLPTYFFRKKEVEMSYLADSLLVMVDCTDILGEMREDLFMNSRDRLRDNAFSLRLRIPDREPRQGVTHAAGAEEPSEGRCSRREAHGLEASS